MFYAGGVGEEAGPVGGERGLREAFELHLRGFRGLVNMEEMGKK